MKVTKHPKTEANVPKNTNGNPGEENNSTLRSLFSVSYRQRDVPRVRVVMSAATLSSRQCTRQVLITRETLEGDLLKNPNTANEPIINPTKIVVANSNKIK
jgi:hypothetical protein